MSRELNVSSQLVVKNLPANAGDARDTVSIPGSGRSHGEGNGSPLQYPYQAYPMHRDGLQFMGFYRVRHD